MTSLTTKESNELLDKASTLNKAVENYYLELAWVLSTISESETYKEAGYDSYAEYVQGDLSRSKTFASNLLLVGDFMRKNEVNPKELDTSYSRLAISIRANKDETPEFVVAAASTNLEDELIASSNSKKAGPHVAIFDEICRVCKNNRFNHE